MPGVFLTFEGPEGAGKTTHISLLYSALSRRGLAVLKTREPGGDPVGERVRDLLLNNLESSEVNAEAELLLFAAARAQNVQSAIVPALKEGKIVLCDRFTDSTLAYQGYGRGLPLGSIRTLNDFATGGLVPHKTFLLDLAPEVGLSRQREGDKNRMEREALAFHERVRSGFLEIAKAEPNRILVIDAARPIEQITNDLLAHVMEAVAV